VDLGLVYKCEAEPLPEGGEKVTVQFTLTAPGCGMGDYLKQDVEQKILGLPGVKAADVQVVLDPPWSQNMMSDVARLQLGLM
jgi:metal-sulfur cluster biosynthetic enzyme